MHCVTLSLFEKPAPVLIVRKGQKRAGFLASFGFQRNLQPKTNPTRVVLNAGTGDRLRDNVLRYYDSMLF